MATFENFVTTLVWTVGIKTMEEGAESGGLLRVTSCHPNSHAPSWAQKEKLSCLTIPS